MKAYIFKNLFLNYFFQDFFTIFSKFLQNFPKISTKFSQNFFKISPKFLYNFFLNFMPPQNFLQVHIP